jgi:uncharacterized membrane protein
LNSLEWTSRWLHVATAAVLLGGAVFQWWAVLPALRPLADEQHTQLRERLAGRWRLVIMLGITLLLVTGFYNYLVVSLPKHKGDGLYHGLMGGKILLALAAFFLGSVLSGRSPKFAQMRRDASVWLLVLILILVTIYGLGAALRVGLTTHTAAVPPPPVNAQ